LLATATELLFDAGPKDGLNTIVARPSDTVSATCNGVQTYLSSSAGVPEQSPSSATCSLETQGDNVAQINDTLWMAAMRRGDFAEAWRISDAHLNACLAREGHDFSLPRHLQSVWDGRPLTDKRVLVCCYHGLGDTVQFLRFAQPLRQIARHVCLWMQPELLPLAAAVRGFDAVLPLHDGAPPSGFDAQIEIMELGHALRVAADDLPRDIPYLSVPNVRQLTLPKGHLRVGLVWAAGEFAPHRSIAATSLSPLSMISDIQLYSLQRGPARAQLRDIPAIDISSPGISRLVAALLSLDLLIAIDTFVAHLAGALGLPVWLLLHENCDWRWMSAPRNTVWYPTMRLFRQRSAGDWAPVIEDASAELAQLVRERRIASRRKHSSGTNKTL
jgi:hypothetical protein